MRKWLVIATASLAAIISLAGIALRCAAPKYVRDRVINTLSDRFGSDVQFQSLDVSLFPRISIGGEGLVLRQKGRTDVPPLITIQAFTAQAGLLELLRRPSRIRDIHLEGLWIRVPPRAHRPEAPLILTQQRTGPAVSVVVGQMIAENARLELLSQAAKPARTFDVHRLVMHDAGAGQPMLYHAWLRNPQPPGEIETQGRLGPWQKEEPGLTPLAGNYTFAHADLGAFRGIAGILSSRGQYAGKLERIDVHGESDTPDFRLLLSGHPEPLHTDFHSIVDGTNGNTLLQPVRARLLNSLLVATGGVVKTPGATRRTVSLDVTTTQARLEDLLRLALKTDEPPISGSVSLQTKLVIPPGEGEVSDRLMLDGEFAVASAKFASLSVQQKVQELSDRGQGIPRNEDAGDVVSDLKGHFTLRNAVLTLSNLTFSVPGASVHLNGTYALHGEELNFRGTLRLQAKLSQLTHGWISVVLKAVDPLFEKEGAGTVLPITVTGTEANPSFKVNIRQALRRQE